MPISSRNQSEFFFLLFPDIEAYKDFDGQVYQVNLDKGRLGIGLSIAGGKGADSDNIFVINVKPDGPADLDGRIIPGDVILEVSLCLIYRLSFHLFCW